MIQTQPNTNITEFPSTPKFDDTDTYEPTWMPDFMEAFGYPGLAALSWTMCSLMAQDIRAEHKSFPFLEITGRPETGKKTLVNFLMKLLGYEEGEWKNAAALTQTQLADHIVDLENMPLVFMNGKNRVDNLEHESVKAFFNGYTAGFPRALNRYSIDSTPPRFKASLMLVKESTTIASVPYLERCIHCMLPRWHQGYNPHAIGRCEEMTRDDLGGFILQVLKHKDRILREYADVYNELYVDGVFFRYGIENERIVKNHNQLAAGGYALRLLFPELDSDTMQLFVRYLATRGIVAQNHCWA